MRGARHTHTPRALLLEAHWSSIKGLTSTIAGQLNCPAVYFMAAHEYELVNASCCGVRRSCRVRVPRYASILSEPLIAMSTASF